MPTRFGGFTVRVDCPACGQPVPLNAPLERAHCAACTRDFPVPVEIFERLLLVFDDEYPTLREPSTQALIAGLQVHATSTTAPPSCEKCARPLELERLPPAETSTFHCTSCGDAALGFPAPEWLRARVATAHYVAVTDVEAAPGLSSRAPVRNASHPVALPCPQCGASLHVTSDSERTVPCEYCKTDVYLPDDLWRRLHPVKVMAPWFVRFEGPSRAELLRQAEAERSELEGRARAEQAERAREAQLQAERAAAEKAAREAPQRARRRVLGSFTFTLLGYVAFLCPIGPCGVKSCAFDTEIAQQKLADCEQAHALLGDDIKPPAFGWEPGWLNPHPDLQASYGALVKGSKASGTYTWKTSSRALQSAELVVNGVRLDVLTCAASLDEKSLRAVSLALTPQQMASALRSPLDKSGFRMELPLKGGPLKTLRLEWDRNDPMHVKKFRFEWQSPLSNEAAVRDKLAGWLGRKFTTDSGSFDADGLRLSLDPASLSGSVTGRAGPRWKEQFDALWDVAEGALGLRGAPADATLLTLLGRSYPPAALASVEPSTDVSVSQATLERLFPGVTASHPSASGHATRYEIQLTHPWFDKAVFEWGGIEVGTGNDFTATTLHRLTLTFTPLVEPGKLADCLTAAVGPRFPRPASFHSTVIDWYLYDGGAISLGERELTVRVKRASSVPSMSRSDYARTIAALECGQGQH